MKHTITCFFLAILSAFSWTACDRLFSKEKKQETAAAAEKSTSQLYGDAAGFVAARQLDEAAGALTEIVRQAPDDATAWLLLCQVDAVRRDAESGPAACEKAIALERNRPDAFAHLGRLYMSVNKPAEAQKQLELAYVLNPKHVPTLSALGAVYLQQKNVEKAVERLRTAFNESDKDAAVLKNLAHGLIALQRCDEAEEVIAHANELGVTTGTLVRLKEKQCAAAPALPAVSVEGMKLFTAEGGAFYLDVRPANGAEFSACVDADVCKRPPYDEFNRKGEGRDEPAMSVNFFGAEAYCGWKGKRLPTLAEYEAAYREVEWQGCCVRGVIPREWTGDGNAADEKGTQVRKSGDSLEQLSKKRKVGVDSSTVRCAVDAPLSK